MLDFSTPMADCVDGELRLVNGSNQREGRLEICFNRAWGTICGDVFNQTEATVACGQLGFARQGAVIYDELICTSLYECVVLNVICSNIVN